QLGIRDRGVVLPSYFSQGAPKDISAARKGDDVTPVVVTGKDPQRTQGKVAVHPAIRDDVPGRLLGGLGELLPQLLLLMHREVRHLSRRIHDPNDLVVFGEDAARSRSQLKHSGLMSIRQFVRYGQGLNRV